MKKSNKLFDCIISAHTIIFAFWVCAGAALAYFGINYQTRTSMYFAAPKDSKAYAGQLVVNQTYSNLTNQEAVAVLVSDPKRSYAQAGTLLCNTALQPDLYAFAMALNTTFAADFPEYFMKSSNYFIAATYYPLSSGLFCKEESTVIDSIFNAHWDGIQEIAKVRTAVNNLFEETLAKKWPDLDISIISTSNLGKEAIDGTMNDLARLDVISIVCGFIIVALFIRQLSLLIISVFNLAITMSISFALSYFVAGHYDVPSFCSAIQSAVIVALTFDYSLFLFSKVKQEIQKNTPKPQIIHETLKSSGHVVLISGLCLAIVFILMLIYPVPMVKIIGALCCITIIIIVLVSITNTAAMLAVCPWLFLGGRYNFWATNILNCKNWCKKPKSDAPIAADHAPANDVNATIAVASPLRESVTVNNEEKKRNLFVRFCTAYPGQASGDSSCLKWYRRLFEWFVSHKWIAAIGIVIVMAISLPFLAPLVKIEHSIDLSMIIPRNSKTLKAAKYFGNNYGAGLVTPFYVVFNKTDGSTDSLVTAPAFTLMAEMANAYITKSALKFPDNKDIQLNNTQVLAPFYFKQPMSAGYFSAARSDLNFQFLLSQVSPHPQNLTTFAMMLTPNVPIMGTGADKFIPFYREIMEEYRPRMLELGIQISEYSHLAPMIDAVEGMFNNFGKVFGITIAVLFVIIGFAFQSFVAPFRLMFENGLVQVFYLGINILIYQYGHSHNDDALFWACIFMMTTISLGLGCDYDVFSFNGAYRAYFDSLKSGKKFSFHECITALGDNLLIVMTAGLIMIISFVGLLFSSLDLLLQFGCSLVIDLAFNCFIVVPIIVPAVTYIFGEATMFPGNLIAKKKAKKHTSSDVEQPQDVQTSPAMKPIVK